MNSSRFLHLYLAKQTAVGAASPAFYFFLSFWKMGETDKMGKGRGGLGGKKYGLIDLLNKKNKKKLCKDLRFVENLFYFAFKCLH